MSRKAEIKRATTETATTVGLQIGEGEPSSIKSGVPFFDHMLDAMSRHGRFRLRLECRGDTEVDDHHTVEDVGICIGKALKKALGDKAGIERFGSAVVPMDDALAMVTVDLSGRAYFRYTGTSLTGLIGRYSEELTVEFLRSLAQNGEMNLHVTVFYGENRHHIHEAVFKALGVALKKAVSVDPSAGGEVPSTKGAL